MSDRVFHNPAMDLNLGYKLPVSTAFLEIILCFECYLFVKVIKSMLVTIGTSSDSRIQDNGLVESCDSIPSAAHLQDPF